MAITPTLGPEITFSTDPNAFNPRITALADDSFIISWESSGDVFARHFNSLGSVTTGNFLSALSAADSKDLRAPIAIQQTDGSIIVEYGQAFSAAESDVRWHLVAPDYTPGTNSFGTQSTPFDELLVDATAWAAGGSAIAYLTPAPTPDGEALTVSRFVAANGLPASNEIVVGPHLPGETQQNASIVGIFNGNIAVAYENFRFSDSERDIRLHIYTPLGQDVADGDEVHVSGFGLNASFPDVVVTNGGTPDIANDGAIVVVWQDDTGIAFKRFSDELGIPLIPEEPATISGTGGATGGLKTSIGPKIAGLNDGGFIIAWNQIFGTESGGSPDFDIAIQRFDINGNPLGNRVFIDNPGDQRVTSLTTLDDGRVVLALENETGDSTNRTTLDFRILDLSSPLLFGTRAADILVASADGSKIFARDGNDIVTGGNADDKLFGQDGDDTLKGLAGDDMLKGGSGQDLLIGGLGRDRLFGGPDADAFDFNAVAESAPTSADTIHGFSRREHDRIDLSDIDANTNVAGDQPFDLIGRAEFSHTAGELRFDHGLLEADVNGDGLADFAVKVAGLARMVDADFLL
jgi:Ca2+-binding RTX toxin-like protein